MQALDIEDAGNLQVAIADPVRDAATGVIGLGETCLGLSRVVRMKLLTCFIVDVTHSSLAVTAPCSSELLPRWPAPILTRGLLFIDGHLQLL